MIRTKTPLPETKAKEKDPKKVAAGRKLAEYNRKAKEALTREMKREAEQNPEAEEKTSESQAWIPELSFTTVLSLVGIGFTALDMFMRYRKNTPDPPKVPSELPEPPASKIPIPQTPKIGML